MGAPGSSYACECIPRTPEDRFDSSDAVFAAEVVDIDEFENRYRVVFNVSEYWKGLSENARYVVAGLGSLDGNTCGYPFQEGEEYLTYAKISGDGLYTGACYGVRELADADDTLAVLGAGTVPRGSAIDVDPDPLDGLAPTMTVAREPDLVLVFIVAAIASLSAGLAVLIVKKPKR
ncbi:MAG TPA: hypothetical protein VFS46_01445 [Nitrososphaera sp.]|nr:hypothetical protein [Nitrososphaera sp.]